MAGITAVVLFTAAVVMKCTFGIHTVEVSCLISNLEHTDCTWSHLELNYTFQSRLGLQGSFQDCPWYLQEGGYNVGCRLPFKTLDKFSSLYTRLSNNNIVTEEQTIVMNDRVKLSPPHNLSVVVNSKNLELWLYWNISAPSTCFESEVRYRKEADQWQSVLASVSATWYSLPQISQKHRYELQVRTRIADDCGQSRFWSDWSTPMFYHVARNTTARIADLHTLICLASVGLSGWLWSL